MNGRDAKLIASGADSAILQELPDFIKIADQETANKTISKTQYFLMIPYSRGKSCTGDSEIDGRQREHLDLLSRKV
jgi:hypothetical protein